MSSPLLKHLRDLIAESGPLSVAKYMEACLYHPQHGYYRTHNPIGAQGDFITAPEISQVFGELIGAWFIDLWVRMGQPAPINLIELGPGRGTLLQDFLRIAPDSFKCAATLHLVEINEVLKEIQQQSLEGYQPHWHTTIDDALARCTEGAVFIIANEFFDALPIHQFINDQEKVIKFDSQKNCLAYDFVPAKHQALETCPLAIEITRKITDRIFL